MENSPEKNEATNDPTETPETTETEAAKKSLIDERVQKLESELQNSRSEHLYLQAEFDNFRKQSIRERSQLIKYGAERFIRDFLDIMDNFERALQGQLTEQNIDQFRLGMELTAKEMRALLDRNGVIEVPCENANFDPQVHEAIGSEETPSVEAGKITRILRKGYRYHDKLLRPGQVVVARAPAPPSSEQSPGSEE